MALMCLVHAWIRGFAALRGVRLRPVPSLATALAFAGLLATPASSMGPAVELRDAELVAAGSPVLQNGAGTVRLEDPRLGRLGPPVFFVPEPVALWQLGSGIGLLALLAGFRRRTDSPTNIGEPSASESDTQKTWSTS
jgi:hypothetical protein